MTVTLHGPPAWMTDAACATTERDLFHPEPGDNHRAAIRICRTCPVTNACLAYAIAHDEREGIWGGHTPAERRRIANGEPANARPIQPCGTVPGYHRHLYNREPTCQPCRDAMTQAINNRRARSQVTP